MTPSRDLTTPTTVDRLRSVFPQASAHPSDDVPRVVVPRDAVRAVLEWLHGPGGFAFLADVTCVDYLHYHGATDRFGLVYLLTNLETNERIIVRTFVNDPAPSVPSVVDLWEAANWLEREVWDLFGIRFEGHPDLRRVVLPPAFESHPLRKDYPLQGLGERHNLPVVRRGEG
ncbi:MAG TPA: NADH-quinone oxidoreductase subunit C [Thermoguttaceae bacterium]|nr:NADH-quinone oxidoreductase subunit C [Thermoguttaceae bacterium]